jgi:hypothetical protein
MGGGQGEDGRRPGRILRPGGGQGQRLRRGQPGALRCRDARTGRCLPGSFRSRDNGTGGPQPGQGVVRAVQGGQRAGGQALQRGPVGGRVGAGQGQLGGLQRGGGPPARSRMPASPTVWSGVPGQNRRAVSISAAAAAGSHGSRSPAA